MQKEQIILVVDNIYTQILGRYPHAAVDEATSFLMPVLGGLQGQEVGREDPATQ